MLPQMHRFSQIFFCVNLCICGKNYSITYVKKSYQKSAKSALNFPHQKHTPTNQNEIIFM